MQIVEAAQKEGWAVRRNGSVVELTKHGGDGALLEGYAINAKWWCRNLRADDGKGGSFRVTGKQLFELLGLHDVP
jgi:hypothetical protein